MNFKYDTKLDIAVGKSRKSLSWENNKILWSDFVKKLSVTHRTTETYEEYISSDKESQTVIKDVGGFVGGYLSGGRRKAANVLHRQIITLDGDFATSDLWENFCILYDNAACIYSTHKHSSDSPRLRLSIPLDKPVNTLQYEAISHKIASILGKENFDETTYASERIMFWPSTSKDGQFVFEVQDGPFMKADEILATCKDIPGQIVSNKIQQDAHEKSGIIGAFCRTYSIEEAIEKFLSDIYESTEDKERYTYKPGTGSGGLIIYRGEGGEAAFSHHGTDPANGIRCNAFDLVQIHKFIHLDKEVHLKTKSIKLPSFQSMLDFAANDPLVKKTIISEDFPNPKKEFITWDGIENDEWRHKLQLRKGKISSTIDNIVIVLENDILLKGSIAFDEFSQRECIKKPMPWAVKNKNSKYFTDADISSLAHYCEKFYGIVSNQKIEHALRIVFTRHSFNPLKDYLKSLTWDNTKRVDTLFIDYLGSEDSPYTRAITRKTLAAAVARVFQPGIKFDYILTLIGPQGIGKSTIIQKLAVIWFSDSFTFHMLGRRESFEQLQAVWLVEVSELTGLKKADVEAAKGFISKLEDRYRVSYGRRTESFPRQCIFIGSTNNREFLKDQTGNRRFWPLNTMFSKPSKNIFKDLSKNEIDQVWAEAVLLYQNGEPLYLTPEIEKTATGIQSDHVEKDDRIGAIEKYLDTLLPADWNEKNIGERKSYLKNEDPLEPVGTVLRTRVCVAEIWCELFEGHLRDLNTYNTKDLHNIMLNMPGWEKATGQKRFRNYGAQRAYIRTAKKSKNSVITQSNHLLQSKNFVTGVIANVTTKN